MILQIQNQASDRMDDSSSEAPIDYIFVVHKKITQRPSPADDDITVDSHSNSLNNDDEDDDDDEGNNSCCPPPAQESKELRWSSEHIRCGRPRSQSCSPSMPAREIQKIDSSSCRRWLSSLTKSESVADFAPTMPLRTRQRSKSDPSLEFTNRAVENSRVVLVPFPSAACQA